MWEKEVIFLTPSISSNTTYYAAAYDTISTSDALFLDGTDDHVAIQSHNYNSSGLTELTVEAWIKTTNGSDQVIASFDRNEYWRLEINGSGAGTGEIGWDVNTDGGVTDFGSITQINDGNWHHVAGVYDNGSVEIYIDGVLDNSKTQGSTYGSGNTRFGFLGVGSEASAYNGSKGPSDFFNGNIDEIRVWSVARTQTEIQQNMDSCLIGAEPNLDVYYKMNDGSGSTVTDHTPNGNDGTFPKHFTFFRGLGQFKPCHWGMHGL